MCDGVAWSGSPTLKSRILLPWALSDVARWAMATVGDTSMARARRERPPAVPPFRLNAPSSGAVQS